MRPSEVRFPPQARKGPPEPVVKGAFPTTSAKRTVQEAVSRLATGSRSTWQESDGRRACRVGQDAVEDWPGITLVFIPVRGVDLIVDLVGCVDEEKPHILVDAPRSDVALAP